MKLPAMTPLGRLALGLAFAGALVSAPAAAEPAKAAAQTASAPAEPAAPIVPAWRFPSYTEPAQVRAACERVLADTRASQPRIERAPRTALLQELDGLWQRQQAVQGPLSLLAAVHPDKRIRDAAEACDLRLQALKNAWLQSRTLYAALHDLAPADAVEARLRQDRLDEMQDAGVTLRPLQRERLLALRERIARLTQDFERRVRDDATQALFTEDELKGVPPELWQDAKRDARGRLKLRPDMALYAAIAEQAHDARARERMWRIGQNQGGGANLHTLSQLASARRELAQLLGHDSYADLLLRRRMAGSEAAARAFLDTVHQAIEARERDDLLTLRQAKAQHLGAPLDRTVLHRWDVAYYVERVRRERHGFDAERFRASMPPRAALAMMFGVAERLFGVSVQPLDKAATGPLWHDDAQAYAVSDMASGEPIGQLFIDLYPREGKYINAAVWPVRNGSSQTRVQPVAALVSNIDRAGVSLADLQILMHEFGHAMHQLLATPRYASHGGLDALLDFVEAPSQMLEDWVYVPEVHELARHACGDCPPVPAEWLRQAEAARHFAKGPSTGRQHLYASFDLALHGREPAEPMALWRQMEGATPLGHAAGTHFPSSFEHVAGFYAAGYYSYLWSQVAADDLRTAFAAQPLDADTGRRYRRDVLAPGAQEHPSALMRRFLGREPNSDAFFRALRRH